MISVRIEIMAKCGVIGKPGHDREREDFTEEVLF